MIHESVELRRVVNGITPQSKRAEAVEIRRRAGVQTLSMAELEQQRILKTAIPGPRSLELMARKTGAVARGIGTTMPVFAVEAGGGVVVDVDGNSLIDFGSGIAVTTIGNSAPRVVAAVQ